MAGVGLFPAGSYSIIPNELLNCSRLEFPHVYDLRLRRNYPLELTINLWSEMVAISLPDITLNTVLPM